MDSKTCPKCLNDFPYVEFLTSSGRKKPYCRECTKAYKRNAYAKNPEKGRAAAKKWVQENAGKYTQYQEQYRQENRKVLNEKAKLYRLENQDAIREKDRLRVRSTEDRKRWYQNFRARMESDPEYKKRYREAAKKAIKKYYLKNQEDILQKLREEYYADVDKARAKTRKSCAIWRNRHPEKVQEINRRRSALRRGAKLMGFDEKAHKDHLRKWQKGKCFHCGQLIEKETLDHYYPAILHGEHSDRNLVLSCSSCNSSKHDYLVSISWNPKTVPDYQFFIEDEEFASFAKNSDVRLLSTFAASDRNPAYTTSTISNLRSECAGVIFDYEWWQRKSAVINFLQNKTNDCAIIGARKTKLVQIESEDAQSFFDQTHLQGFGAGSLYLGLVYEDELVGCTSWLFPKKAGRAIELNRLAFKGRVIGGFSKMISGLLSHDMYLGQPILSFVDPRYASGKSYETVGFTYAGETAAPVYYYVNPEGLFHRRLFMKHKLEKQLQFFDPSLSEKQNAAINGCYRVYGMKQKKYILNTDLTGAGI